MEKQMHKNIYTPEWANFLVQNSIGDWYAYEFAPAWSDEKGYYAPDGKEKLVLENDVMPENEKDTLIRI
jgi:hypothetical protein